jgi:hypothetical protein
MHAVVTLVEGDFLYGAAALYNSLVANHFDGVFIVGHRGRDTLPISVLTQMESLPANLPEVKFVQVETSLHFTNYKPTFILRISEDFPELNAITYFDPDIVVSGPWSWLSRWNLHGPAVAGDVNWRVGPNHPTRHEWSAMLRSTNLEVRQCPETYINGGMVSVRLDDLAFIDLWKRLIREFGARDNPLDSSGDITTWRKGGRWNPMHTPDQDALNLTAMAWGETLSILGPDAMGFAAGGPQMISHAVGPDKPWKRAHFREVLLGRPPRYVDKAYLNNALSPILLQSSALYQWRLLKVGLAAFIGRFYRRGQS